MIHVARRLLVAVVVLAIVAGATLALSSRPRLETDRNAVEEHWRAVQPALGVRYARLDTLAQKVEAAGGPANPITDEVATTYANWKALNADSPVDQWISTANTLEGLARRLTVTVDSSPILKADHAVSAALTAMTNSPIPAAVTPLNDSVARYEKDRGGPVRRLVAGPLGYTAIPRLVLAAGD